MTSDFSRRLAPFLLFAVISTAVLPMAWSALGEKAVPTLAELGSLEAEMMSGARLHPPLPPAELPGTALFCRECHPGLPHAGSGVGPVMRNEHARRMDCLVCHWSAASGPRPAAVWIARAAGGKGGEILALLPSERSNRDALAGLRSAVTARRTCFERGLGCTDCHRSGGIGALLRPGTSAARAAGLERLEDYYTLPPGQKWYFPQMN